MNQIELFEQTAMLEQQAWENFKARYVAQVPPPQKASVEIWRTIGWQLVMILLQAVGAIGLASLRTAEMFYIASAGALPGLRVVEAALAILAIEFGIVVFAAIRAEANNRNVSDTEKLNALSVSTAWLVVGEIVMLAISIVAGLGVSFKGFDVSVDFSFPLAVVLGAGASIVAAVAGMVIGAMLARWGNVRDAADIKYRNEYASWEEGLRESWEKSPDQRIALNQLKLAKKALPKELVRPFGGPNERTSPVPQTSEIKNEIWNYLEEHATHEFVPGPTEVANALGCSKSYCSDIIKEFKQANPIPPQPTPQPIGND
jgi:hypothetical protein